MFVYEAAGSGLQNHQLVNNVFGIAQFTYGTGGATFGNNNFGFGSSAQTSADGFMAFTWNTKFGTVPPNVYFNILRQDSTCCAQANVMAIASGSMQVMFYQQTFAQLTATKAMGARIITGAELAVGSIFLSPYSATGTSFS